VVKSKEAMVGFLLSGPDGCDAATGAIANADVLVVMSLSRGLRKREGFERAGA
jgi:hypothetical protein